MKKLITVCLCFWALVLNVSAKEKVDVYIFTKEDEPISASTIEYFKNLKDSNLGEMFDYHEIVIWDKDWHQDEYNRNIADIVAASFEDEILGAPYIVIGNDYKLATYTENFNADIEKAITDAYDSDSYEDLIVKAKDEISHKKRNDLISFVVIVVATLSISTLFVIMARKEEKA